MIHCHITIESWVTLQGHVLCYSNSMILIPRAPREIKVNNKNVIDFVLSLIKGKN